MTVRSMSPVQAAFISMMAAVFFLTSEASAHGLEPEKWIAFTAVVHLLVSFIVAISITFILRGKESPVTRVFLPSMLILLTIVPAKLALYFRFDWQLPGFGSDPSVIVYYVIITLFTALLVTVALGRRK